MIRIMSIQSKMVLLGITNCSVCRDEFDGKIYTLACGHAVCPDDLGEEGLPLCYPCKSFSREMDELVRNLALENLIGAMKQGKDYEELLKCPNCLKELKDPKIIECGHTFCNKCYRSHITDGNKRDCDICGEEWSHSTDNQSLSALIRSLKSGELTASKVRSLFKKDLDSATIKSLKEVISCSVCLGALKTPYVLSCGHAMCSNELGKDEVFCKSCGIPSELMEEDIRNRNLRKFIKALRRGEYSDEFIKCGICSREMVDSVIVNCGHSFCSKCINTHIHKNHHKRCPVCREVVALMTENYSIDSVIRLSSKLKEGDLLRFTRQSVSVPPA